MWNIGSRKLCPIFRGRLRPFDHKDSTAFMSMYFSIAITFDWDSRTTKIDHAIDTGMREFTIKPFWVGKGYSRAMIHFDLSDDIFSWAWDRMGE